MITQPLPSHERLTTAVTPVPQHVACGGATYLADIPDHLPPANEDRSTTYKTTLEQKINAVTVSLAMLEEGQGHPRPPLLLALRGDVHIKDCDQNLLLQGMSDTSRPADSIFWSKSIPPAAKCTHKRSCSSQALPTTAGQQQLCRKALQLLFADVPI